MVNYGYFTPKQSYPDFNFCTILLQWTLRSDVTRKSNHPPCTTYLKLKPRPAKYWTCNRISRRLPPRSPYLRSCIKNVLFVIPVLSFICLPFQIIYFLFTVQCSVWCGPWSEGPQLTILFLIRRKIIYTCLLGMNDNNIKTTLTDFSLRCFVT